jgi:hypothetical protein
MDIPLLWCSHPHWVAAGLHLTGLSESQLNPCNNSPYVTSSLTRRWVCLIWICLAFHQAYVWHVIENSSCCTIYKSSVSTGFAKQIMPILCILFYNSSLVTWMVVSLTGAKFKPIIFSVFGFALSYTMNMFILMILYDFSLLPAQFCYYDWLFLLTFIILPRVRPQKTPSPAALLLSVYLLPSSGWCLLLNYSVMSSVKQECCSLDQNIYFISYHVFTPILVTFFLVASYSLHSLIEQQK